MTKTTSVFFWVVTAALAIPALGGVMVYSGAPDSVPEATFFSFDLRSVPFRRNVDLNMVRATKRPDPVLNRGPRSSFDELRAEYYGSVLRIGDHFRMWYVGYGFENPEARTYEGVTVHIGYAESQDGIQWTKPNLGLVNYHGNTANNIVRIEPEDYTIRHPDRNVHVLYEPDDPDPSRHYKMVIYAAHEGGRGTVIPLLSADGLRWRYARPTKLVPGSKDRITFSSMSMPNEHLEGGGLVRYGGLYYHNGQAHNDSNGRFTGRLAVTYVSSDFVQWLPEKVISFMRWGYDKKEPISEGREVHEGISLWNRGNVLVGLYGMWEGSRNWGDRRVHFGVVTSTDAIEYREPVHDFIFAAAGKQGEWDAGGILQGQSFFRVGDADYIWYGSWNLAASGGKEYDPAKDMLDPHGAVGLMTIPHDRFGYVTLLNPNSAKKFETQKEGTGSLMTAMFQVAGAPATVALNCEDADAGRLRLELLDRTLKPVPGFSREDFIGVRAGFEVPALWRGGKQIPQGAYRLRAILDWRGERAAKLYAMYVRSPQVAR